MQKLNMELPEAGMRRVHMSDWHRHMGPVHFLPKFIIITTSPGLETSLQTCSIHGLSVLTQVFNHSGIVTIYAIYFVYRYFHDFGLRGEVHNGLFLCFL